MNYIINPAWFYWISVADNVKIVDAVLSMIVTCIGTLTAIGGFIDEDDNLKKRGFHICALAFVMWVVFALIPDKNTLIEMQIARLATYDNANWTVDAMKSAVDYIVEAIKSLK